MLLLLSSLVHAMPVIEEGPWMVNVCVDNAGTCTAGTALGEVWATNPGSGANWTEMTERTSDWSFVTATTSWYVTVPATAGSLQCGSPACQKVGVSTTDTLRPKAPFADLPGSGIQSYLEWHAAGKYEITAFFAGGPKTAYYYVADAGNNTRSERLCAQTGFRWPGRSDGAGDPVVSWRVKLVSAGTPVEACPAFWKKTESTVSLAP